MAANTTDELLSDISARIQLPPSMHNLAVERYGTVAKYLERESSPLKDRVLEIYTQGSMAIGATIKSMNDQDDDLYDIDLIAEIDPSVGNTPDDFLDALYRSVKGERGSRYYDCTERQTRCVTIQYKDMHVDITPMVRVSYEHQTIARAGKISHADPDKLQEQGFVENNSAGLSAHINEAMPDVQAFSKRYAELTEQYDQRFLKERAEIQPAPEQEDLEAKSVTTVALQLIKRHMQVAWSSSDRKDFRKPPTVILSLLAAENALGNGSLADEVIHLSKQIAETFDSNQPVTVFNPTYPKDILTDRWPEQDRLVEDQKMLSDDLYALSRDIELVSKLSLKDKKDTLTKLFGEKLTERAYENFYERNNLNTKKDTRTVLPKTGAVALVGITKPSNSNEVTPPKKTSWGGFDED